jgi:hypothetical protein
VTERLFTCSSKSSSVNKRRQQQSKKGKIHTNGNIHNIGNIIVIVALVGLNQNFKIVFNYKAFRTSRILKIKTGMCKSLRVYAKRSNENGSFHYLP